MSRTRTYGFQDTRQRAPARVRPLPLALTVVLYGTLGIFAVANIYDYSLSAQLGLVKWGMLAVLCLVGMSVAKEADSAGGKAVGWPLLLLFAAILSLTHAQSITQSASFLVSVVLVFLATWLVAERISTVSALRAFFDIVANIGRAVIVTAAVMWPLGISLGRGGDRFSAWTDNPNTLALLLAPALVILIAGIIERGKGWYIWHLPFVLAGLFLLQQTGSRAAILWLVLSVGAFGVIRHGSGVTAIGGAFVAILGITLWDSVLGLVLGLAQREGQHGAHVASDLLSGRSEMWPLGLRLFEENPFLGHGLGSSGRLIEESYWVFIESQGHHFHNSYLTVLVETGLVGLLAFLLVVLVAMVNGFAMAQSAGRRDPANWPTLALPWALVLGAMGHGLFETWLFSAGNANAVLFWICIWLLLRGSMKRRHLPGSPETGFSWQRRFHQRPPML